MNTGGATTPTFTARPATNGLTGRIRVPGDKSISHRCILLAAKAPGASTITGLSPGGDVMHTLAAVELFGAGVDRLPGDASPGVAVTIRGGPIHEPSSVVDVGNSGTGIRLLAGWAAPIDGVTVLFGDSSIALRPMDRIATPLRRMGAAIDGREGGRLPPVVIRGGGLHGIDYDLPVPSAQVKGAVLLAGLGAQGSTTVRESAHTRMHTEELLTLFGADIETSPGSVTVKPSELAPTGVRVPGDPSQAAFWVVAACVVEGSDLLIEDVYTGPARAGFLDVLRRMGADITLIDDDPSTSTSTLRVRHSHLTATEVGGSEIPGLIDEIPVLAVAAAHAEGRTTFSDAAELKVKESDRIATMVAALTQIGVDAEAFDDGLAVTGSTGPTAPAGAAVESAGDHRVAMSMAVAGMAAAGPVIIGGWGSVATSYPSFEEDYHRCAS